MKRCVEKTTTNPLKLCRKLDEFGALSLPTFFNDLIHKILLSKNRNNITNVQVKYIFFKPHYRFCFLFISDSSPIFEILTKHSRNPNWKPGRRVPRLVTSSFFVPCIFIGRNAILRPMKTCLPSRFHLAPKPKFQPRHL